MLYAVIASLNYLESFSIIQEISRVGLWQLSAKQFMDVGRVLLSIGLWLVLPIFLLDLCGFKNIIVISVLLFPASIAMIIAMIIYVLSMLISLYGFFT